MNPVDIQVLVMGSIVVAFGLFASYMDCRQQDAAARVRADDVT